MGNARPSSGAAGVEHAHASALSTEMPNLLTVDEFCGDVHDLPTATRQGSVSLVMCLEQVSVWLAEEASADDERHVPATSSSDSQVGVVQVIVWFEDEKGQASERVKFTTRRPQPGSLQTLHFNVPREVSLWRAPNNESFLHFQLWDAPQGLASEKLGPNHVMQEQGRERALSCTLPGGVCVADGFVRGADIDPMAIVDAKLPLTDTARCAAGAPVSLRFWVRSESLLPRQKWIFFVRHAESRWNRAQKTRNLLGLFSEIDHPISEQGLQQCEQLASKIECELQGGGNGDESELSAVWGDFLDPEVVFVSPFTRALQTAVIALRPVLDARGTHAGQLILMPAAREKRNFMGVDSKGSGTAAQVLDRVRQETESLCHSAEEPWVLLEKNDVLGEHTRSTEPRPRHPALELLDRVDFNSDDPSMEDQWWTSVYESGDKVDSRLTAFVRQLRLSPHRRLIVVGHSHFFQALFKHYLHSEALKRRPELCGRLQAEVLPNCGVLAAFFDWDVCAREGLCRECIVDVAYLHDPTPEPEADERDLSSEHSEPAGAQGDA